MGQVAGGRPPTSAAERQEEEEIRRVCLCQSGLTPTAPSLTCVTEYGPKEARRPGLGAGPSGSGGSTKRLCEEEKGLELEKMGPRSACDNGRRSQEGGTTSMSTGKESGRGSGWAKTGWGRDRDTERVTGGVGIGKKDNSKEGKLLKWAGPQLRRSCNSCSIAGAMKQH